MAIYLNQFAPDVGFGTSGVRALVSDLTPQVVAAYTRAFIGHLRNTQQLETDSCVLAWDLRPSSPQIASSVAAALLQEGLKIDWAGCVPTPALALRALTLRAPGIMVSGSHIPFDRNGIKFYTARGEILKSDEAGIEQIDLSTRLGGTLDVQTNAQDLESLITQMNDDVVAVLKSETPAYLEYVDRYISLLPQDALNGIKVGIYQHSAVGRDLLPNLLERLGASVVVLGRSDTFVPIDTEAVAKEDEDRAKAWCDQHQLDAVVSTDGDGDRPWICDENGRFVRGDIVGILTAQWLGAKAVVTPVSSNTALEKSQLFNRTLRTRIGSPFVIEGMQALAAEGVSGVVGFEANGGFLVQDSMRGLSALPTRDSLLPILAVLVLAKDSGVSLSHLAEMLPKRFTQADRVKNCPTKQSQALIFDLAENRDQLSRFLSFSGSSVLNVDVTDGLRSELANGDIVHLRPSGNAPELRCYVESVSDESAMKLLSQCLMQIRSLVEKL